jgi:hypothetical protein
MSTDDSNMEGVDEGAREAGPQEQCGCRLRCRSCRIVVLLLVLIALGGAVVYWLLYARVYRLDVFRSAMQAIKADAGLQQELGQPIKVAGWRPPNARLESNERDIRWEIAGPKASARAHLSARLMRGKWEIIQVEIDLAGGKRVSLNVGEDGADAAPRFEAPETTSAAPESKAPAPDINLPVPQ